MSPTTLSTLAGAMLSLAFSYLPGLSAWYARLGERPEGSGDGGTRKRLVMLAALLFSTGIVVLLSCSGWGDLAGAMQVDCDRPGLVNVLQSLLGAIVANQSVHRISPQPVPTRG